MATHGRHSLFRVPDPAHHLYRSMTADRPDGRDPSESQIVHRYLGDQAPDDMSRRTAMIRGALRREQKRRFGRYQKALLVLAVVAVAVSGYAYLQHRRVERAKGVAQDLFYAMKALELEVGRLQLTADERASYRARQADLARQYHGYLEDLGVYGRGTPKEIQVIYRVVHRFGESEINVPEEFVQEVRRFIRRWRDSGRLTTSLARATEHAYGPRIAEIMLANDLPPEFFYVALQESDLKTEAVGRPTRFGIAKGMWQFMPETGRAYGLRIGPLVGQPRADPADDRHDFEKSTAAAARYLKDIYSTDAQASGLLVIASYNWGQSNVLRLIRAMPENPRERNFWRLLSTYRDRIPRETNNYVLAIVSAAVIAEQPDLFGFAVTPPLPAGGAASSVADGP